VGDAAGDGAADELLDQRGGGHEALDVDAGGDAEVVEQGHQLLGGEVAAGAVGEGRAAQPADGRVEPGEPQPRAA
jgi:hypothetical protein